VPDDADRSAASEAASSASGASPHQAQRQHRLASEARAAAEQALRLARLAEESARLAQELNARLIEESGGSIPVASDAFDSLTNSPAPASSPTPPDAGLPVLEGEPPIRPARARTKGRGHTTARARERIERLAANATDVDRPRVVRIRANPEDAKWQDDAITTVRRQWKSVTLSTILHAILFFLLGFVTIAVKSEQPITTVLASFAEEETIVEEELPVEQPLEEPGEQQEEPMPEEVPPEPLPEEPPPPEPAAEPVESPLPTPGPEPASEPAVDLSNLGSRSEAGRAQLLEKYGGTAASESAVQRALEWFASRQRPDGSWNFNDVGPCGDAGETDNPMGATAYVLLCYLGAGQTHQQGKFKPVVGRGLNYLVQRGRRVPAGGDFRGPMCEEHDNFYVQGAVAIALSEAATLTRDRRLRQAAESAVLFIINAQDPAGGGWRYAPREPGCTSVTALQLMALVSARRAGAKIPGNVLEGVAHFLDTVRSDQSPTGRYGYRVEEPDYRASTTAMALLCRMYLGWSRDHEELQKGIAIIDDRGPYENLYYCYYATQLMKNWGGAEWERWNSVMRDDLVRTQVSREGPEFGSWTPRDRSGPSMAGGRLFITCLATMTLEVYYRYLPLYEELLPADKAVADSTTATPPSETPPAEKGPPAADPPAESSRTR
jgi:hypothetical protein